MNVSQQVMSSQSFLRRLGISYENASSEIEVEYEVVYGDNQFASEYVASLEHWVLEINSDEEGSLL